MSKSNDFNIFSVLSKDDKELIHSAFLIFLIPRYKFIKDELLGADFGETESICPEVTYRYSVKSKSRKKNIFRADRIR